MASTSITRAGGRERLPKPEPPPQNETAARREAPDGGERKKNRKQTVARVPQHRRKGKTREPFAGPVEIYDEACTAIYRQAIDQQTGEARP